MQPVGESWSKDCVLALQRRVSNRILRIEIQGEHEGKALVALIDEASDPQTNVAELLTSADFAAPAPVNTSNDQQANQKETVTADQHGGKCLILISINIRYKVYPSVFLLERIMTIIFYLFRIL